MIITEYMENGSLDAFLRVGDFFIISQGNFILGSIFCLLFSSSGSVLQRDAEKSVF